MKMSKLTFFGHPIHIMLVHFPIVFFLLSTALDTFSLFYNNLYFTELAFYSLTLGVASGILAAGFGAFDLIKIKNDHTVLRIALLHGGLNVLWLMIFGVIVGIQSKQLPDINIINSWFFILKIFSTAGLLFSNFLGGELILKHGVGCKTK